MFNIKNVRWEFINDKIRIYNPYGALYAKIKYLDKEIEVNLRPTMSFYGAVCTPVMTPDGVYNYTTPSFVAEGGCLNIYPYNPDQVSNIIVDIYYVNSGINSSFELNKDNNWHWENPVLEKCSITLFRVYPKVINFSKCMYVRSCRGPHDIHYVNYTINDEIKLYGSVASFPLSIYSSEYDKLYYIKCFLYSNSSEGNRLDKTNFLTQKYEYDITFKDAVDLIEPSILIKTYDLLTDVNYVYIPVLNRYYYIDNTIIVRSGLFQLDLRCDVLMSYKVQILDLECFVNRQENNYDDRLIDNKIIKFPDYETEIIDGRNIWFEDLDNVNPNDYDYYCSYVFRASRASYVDTTEKPSVDTGFSGTYIMNKRCVSILSDSLWGNRIVDALGNLFTNKGDNIISLTLYPFDLYTFIGSSNFWSVDKLRIGLDVIGVDYTGIGDTSKRPQQLIKNDNPIRKKCGYITIPCGDAFYEYEPFKHVTVFIPYYGLYDLPYNRCASISKTDGHNTISLDFYYVFDFYTNSALIEIRCWDVMVDTLSCSVGVAIDLSYADIREFGSKLINASVSFGTKTISNIANKKYLSRANEIEERHSSQLYRHNAKSFESRYYDLEKYDMNKDKILEVTRKNIVSDALNSITELGGFNSYSNPASGSTFNYMALNGDSLTPFAIVETQNLYRVNNYNHLVGRPSTYSGKLSNLSGYTEVGSVHMDGFSNALPQEINEIENILKTGVVL